MCLTSHLYLVGFVHVLRLWPSFPITITLYTFFKFGASILKKKVDRGNYVCASSDAIMRYLKNIKFFEFF